MNKIGKWTGIALLGASVIAFDVLALSVGFGAARELRASPEVHAVSVATRIVVRAVVRQVVGGAMRAADDLNWAGVRGAPDAIAVMAAGFDPDPNLDPGIDPNPNLDVRRCDRDIECRVEQARRAVIEVRCQLRDERVRAGLNAQIERALEREQVRLEDRARVRARVREVIARFAGGVQTI